MTLGEWIRRNAVNADGVENLIRCWTQPGFGADPNELSFLYVLWYVACSGNERNVGTFSRNSDTAGGAQERRFVGGSQLIPLRLARRLGDIVALAAPVHRITQGDRHAVVHTGRGRVTARRVIVAAPPPLVLDIDWYPRLPDRRLQLLRHLDMGQLMKCDAVYRKPFWREAGLNGFGINDHGAVRAAFDNCPRPGDPGVLLAFVGGSTWRRYGVQTLAQRRRAVLEGFAEMFGDQALHPIDYVEHDWTRERWTKGGPVANYAPGTMVQFGRAIRRPVPPGALGRHRDLDVLDRLHGRRGPLRQARGGRSPGAAVRARVLALLALAGLLLPLAPAAAAPREKWDTRVFASVPAPGYPAYVFTHRNGRVYAGTYTNPQGDRHCARGSSSGRRAARCCGRGPCPGRTSPPTAGCRWRTPTPTAGWCCSRSRPRRC